jgi:cation-transporting P-type ATPase I
VSRGAGSALGRLATAAGVPGRGVWSVPGRHHIELRGAEREGGEDLAQRVEAMLQCLPGVLWARVNAPSARVIVAVGPPEPPLSLLLDTVATAEGDHRLSHTMKLGTNPEPPHPPEEGPRTRRALATIAADAVGLGISALTRVAPFTPLPGELAGLANFVDQHPRLRALVSRRLHGKERADSVLPLVEALAQGLAGGSSGILVDGTQRVLQWREARAQLAAWCDAEQRLSGTPEWAAAPRIPYERPCGKPDGPVERYASLVMSGGAAAGGLGLPMAGFKRAAAGALATLPKAAYAGREAYAAQVGRLLAARGVIAMDRGVLRELERLDTLVLDVEALRRDRLMLTDMAALPGADEQQVAELAFTLFDPDQPEGLRSADGWALGPLAELDLRGRTGAREARRLGQGAAVVLGLARDGRLAAVLRAEPEPDPDLQSIVAAAREAGLRLVAAGAQEEPWYADRFLPGGPGLAGSVRALQGEGAMVMLVSGNRYALSACDCGLGVHRAEDPPPWGAHLLVGADLSSVALVVRAAGVARAVARRSITLAKAGSGLGSTIALTADPARLPGPAQSSVNGAAAIAVASGFWSGYRLDGVPTVAPSVTVPWHLMPADRVLRRLRTGPDGLSTRDTRRGTSGGGDEGIALGLGRALVDELSNPLAPVLAAGAGLSAIVGSPVDAALVGGVLGLSALAGAVQRVATERSLSALLSRSAVSARVRRGGVEQVVVAGELVPGDIVAVGPGDVVAADCRVLEAHGLEADESSLTGESLPVAKTEAPVIAAAIAERRSMLYEGTTVAAGRGLAVVVAVGADTEVGRGMALARENPPDTGVEAQLSKLTRNALPLAAGSAVAVVAAGLAHRVPMTETAATAANLAVASVPEGLPFLVSAAQLAAARRLAGTGALVRNPRTIEALGRVDVLCFDKTGTLTEGRLELAGVGTVERYATAAAGLEPVLGEVLSAALRATPPPRDGAAIQTDQAVLEGAERAGAGVATGAPDWRCEASLPFEPSRGYHATVGASGGRRLLSVKGAPERILPRCGRQRVGAEDRPVDQAGRDELLALLERHAGAGHRVLAIAERDWPGSTVADEDVDDLTFLGFVALADSVRESATPAVQRIRAAGVHTVMITGDHPATAEAVAATIADDDREQRVVTGAELDRLDSDALADLLMRTDVVARCTPSHKVRIIQALQAQGHAVAMTGDGANDAPAIRLADVGIALGHRGTPAASAAADLVVTDDRLETIIAALVEGRAMWSSVRQALGILVGGNLGEIVFNVLSAAISGRSPLTSRQLLLVNLLTDLAPAMAIAVRPPGKAVAADLLADGPDVALDKLLTQELSLRATSTVLGATAGWTLGRLTGARRAGTVALAALVGTQLGQTLMAGGANPATLAAIAASAAALVLVVQTPGLSQFFGCVPLGPVGWTIALGSATGATLGNAALTRLLGGEEQAAG